MEDVQEQNRRISFANGASTGCVRYEDLGDTLTPSGEHYVADTAGDDLRSVIVAVLITSSEAICLDFAEDEDAQRWWRRALSQTLYTLSHHNVVDTMLQSIALDIVW
jgi:hypothetical protein